MAYVSNFTCTECGEPKREVETYPNPNICCNCKAAKERHKKKAHLDFLKGLPLERRLEKLEEQMYELSKLENRLKDVELHFVKY